MPILSYWKVLIMQRLRLRLSAVLWLVAIAATMLSYCHIRASRITLELRQVEGDVVVARGRYHSFPLPDHAEDEIEIYAREIAKEEDDRGGGAGVFPAFLRSMEKWIGRPIVNEVDLPPKKNIAWHFNRREAPTEKARRDDREGALVLKHLEEQTGLTFTREKRSIRILFVQLAVASKQLFMKSGK